jgi:hypothetical protein
MRSDLINLTDSSPVQERYAVRRGPRPTDPVQDLKVSLSELMGDLRRATAASYSPRSFAPPARQMHKRAASAINWLSFTSGYEVRQGKRSPAKARNGDNGSIAEGPPHRPGSRARTGLLGSMRSLAPSKDVTAVGRHQFPRAERGKGKRRRRGAYATLPQPGNNEEDQGRCSLAIQITPGGMAQFPICRRSGQPPPPIG